MQSNQALTSNTTRRPRPGKCKFNKGVRVWNIHPLTLNTSQFGEVIGELTGVVGAKIPSLARSTQEGCKARRTGTEPLHQHVEDGQKFGDGGASSGVVI
ncbi:hypothetical protein AVEN_165238-1 [Araneus ventricosus]|uniref:Uncharacterized protein n=1 Tax=Araneus ventricosus TaxID=182803 RepID=A0A4Y2B607_ARAVE|nr:hypothetical protein AVEN_165238-1 [Araneus ventricosus]